MENAIKMVDPVQFDRRTLYVSQVKIFDLSVVKSSSCYAGSNHKVGLASKRIENGLTSPIRPPNTLCLLSLDSSPEGPEQFELEFQAHNKPAMLV